MLSVEYQLEKERNVKKKKKLKIKKYVKELIRDQKEKTIMDRVNSESKEHRKFSKDLLSYRGQKFSKDLLRKILKKRRYEKNIKILEREK